MKLILLVASLLLGTVICQNTGIAITGVITGQSTGSSGANSGSANIPENGYLLFGPIVGPANNLSFSFTVTNGAPVDFGVMATTNYQLFLNGASPAFISTQNNLENVTTTLTVPSGSSVYILVGNNLVNPSASSTGSASTISYSFIGATGTIGLLAVNSRPIPTTGGTTTGTTGTAGSTSGSVSILNNEYYFWSIPGPISGASATFGVSSGAPIDVLLLADNNFNLFQNSASYVSLFRNLSVTTASFPSITLASGSTLYIVIGNALSNLATNSLASVVQYQLTGFPSTATLNPTKVTRNNATATTTGTTTGVIITGVITGAATTGTTGTTGNSVTIPSNQFSQWVATGPFSGASASFVVTSGSPIDVLFLVDQNYNLFLNGQPYERAFQVLNTQSVTASPINLNSGSILYILAGNGLATGGSVQSASTVQYTLNGFPSGQLTGPTLTNTPGAGVITTSTPQSSGSTVIAQWVMMILCALSVVALL